MEIMSKIHPIGIAAVLVAGLCASASAGDAVSGLNGKIGSLYGSVDGEGATAAEASISMPLGNRFGFQADAMIGEVDPEDVHGVGGHLFWRDSDIGLLGVNDSWFEYENIEVNRVGIEGEYYFGQLTFTANLGHQAGDIEDAGYGGIEALFYPMGDLMLSTAWRRADNEDQYGVGAEYQTPLSGLSVFAQVASGDNDYEHAFGGLRFYFGKEKTLLRRHREDDPASMLLQSLTANMGKARMAAAASEFDRMFAQFLRDIQRGGGFVQDISSGPPHFFFDGQAPMISYDAPPQTFVWDGQMQVLYVGPEPIVLEGQQVQASYQGQASDQGQAADHGVSYLGWIGGVSRQ